ncbi:MAG: hypothetical protein HYX86_03445 [Chloroflexi bacterium]|nr:hypothetical protein [Chloroflexota bacterium]
MLLIWGIVAGIPVAIACAAYTWSRREFIVPAMKEEGRMKGMTDREMGIAATLSFGVTPLFWAVLGALVFPLVSAPQTFLIAAVITSLLASLANIPRRTKLFRDFLTINLITGLGLGLLIPWIMG